MFCLIAIGSALTYLFASRTLKPLEDLTERVQHIDIHNLDEGVSIPQTKDEVAKLAQAFQNMTEKLNLSYQVQKIFLLMLPMNYVPLSLRFKPSWMYFK